MTYILVACILWWLLNQGNLGLNQTFIQAWRLETAKAPSSSYLSSLGPPHESCSPSMKHDTVPDVNLVGGIMTSMVLSCWSLCLQHSAGNGQIKRFSSTLWKTIVFALKSKGSRRSHWPGMLLDALYSVCSLLSMATNIASQERLLSFHHSQLLGSHYLNR